MGRLDGREETWPVRFSLSSSSDAYDEDAESSESSCWVEASSLKPSSEAVSEGDVMMSGEPGAPVWMVAGLSGPLLASRSSRSERRVGKLGVDLDCRPYGLGGPLLWGGITGEVDDVTVSYYLQVGKETLVVKSHVAQSEASCQAMCSRYTIQPPRIESPNLPAPRSSQSKATKTITNKYENEEVLSNGPQCYYIIV